MTKTGVTGLATLPNLGPKSQAILASIGIASEEELRRWGAVAAYARAKQADRRVSLNLLWALEGALTGLPWQVVAREHRTSLLLALDSHSRGGSHPARDGAQLTPATPPAAAASRHPSTRLRTVPR